MNAWGASKLKQLLNNGPYYNRTKGTCYIAQYNKTTSCDFSSNGLTVKSKEMIDTVTWNTGTAGSIDYTVGDNGLTHRFYNYERSGWSSLICQTSSTFCNDTVKRAITWKGQIGLMYPSDYGYATSGGSATNRESCLNTPLNKWYGDSSIDCKNNDWLYHNTYEWLLTPCARITTSDYTRVSSIINGLLLDNSTYGRYSVFPSLFLKLKVKVINGEGTKENPYILKSE